MPTIVCVNGITTSVILHQPGLLHPRPLAPSPSPFIALSSTALSVFGIDGALVNSCMALTRVQCEIGIFRAIITVVVALFYVSVR